MICAKVGTYYFMRKFLEIVFPSRRCLSAPNPSQIPKKNSQEIIFLIVGFQGGAGQQQLLLSGARTHTHTTPKFGEAIGLQHSLHFFGDVPEPPSISLS